MTEQTQGKTRRSMALPTAVALDVLVRWAVDGPASLTPAPAGSVERRRQRSRVMEHLRRLADTLDPDPVLARELGLMRQREFARLSDALLAELARQARIRGFVTAGCLSRVPMTPVQTHTLYKLTWGATYEQIGREEGSRPTSVAEIVGRTRADNGCASTAQLAACAYRNGWFPDQAELKTLLSGRMVWTLPGRTGLDHPPYTYAGEKSG